MNWASIAIGIIAIGFGLLTVVFRMTDPTKLTKLTAMKEQWGDSTGNLLHLIAYTIMPLLVGIAALAAGLSGISFFGR